MELLRHCVIVCRGEQWQTFNTTPEVTTTCKLELFTVMSCEKLSTLIDVFQVEEFCRALGAKVQSNLSKHATHLIIPEGQAPDTSDKVTVKALSSGVNVVNESVRYRIVQNIHSPAPCEVVAASSDCRA